MTGRSARFAPFNTFHMVHDSTKSYYFIQKRSREEAMRNRSERRSFAAMVVRHAVIAAAAATLAVSVAASAAQAEDVCVVKSTDLDFAALEPLQNAANAKPGSRVVPARIIPLPTTTSPKFQAMVAAPYRVPAWDANPKSAA